MIAFWTKPLMRKSQVTLPALYSGSSSLQFRSQWRLPGVFPPPHPELESEPPKWEVCVVSLSHQFPPRPMRTTDLMAANSA